MANQASSSLQWKHARLTKSIGIVIVLIAASVILVLLWHPLSSAIPGERILLNGTMSVDSSSYWYLQFVVPPDSNQIRVSGNFTVSGFNGSEIRIYIMSESNFKKGNFPEYGGSFKSNYDSGLVTSANFDVALSSGGTYYLVFDNIFSNSLKRVDARANLSYYYIPS